MSDELLRGVISRSCVWLKGSDLFSFGCLVFVCLFLRMRERNFVFFRSCWCANLSYINI